ncbi:MULTISPECIES: zf-TFIIB domain-containing protein [unclassified Cupriavidus]|uniref:TFIIB-type zinc ribbon-containing protein n=1 Tax=unclassified Cupriavidus TaxID=2640874 RepID=UPI0004282F8E|nr:MULTISPECIES: zf-TFIIB domain-containing protein [unclassified Cupriavidus]MBP0627626.1 zf-TFIIB domain-containing protein [Cupriavidus sp. AcVe19-1a]MBP0639270.1 zf-TFIIB domain-containing protein [Cupriavidus sp. AcVe19-6a]
MDCPVCPQTQLVMSERQGIEIDYCPKCRGVWLDRGELDKILERSVAAAPATQAAAPVAPPQQSYGDRDRGHEWGRARHHDGDRHYDERQQKHYRKKSIWHELFD